MHFRLSIGFIIVALAAIARCASYQLYKKPISMATKPAPKLPKKLIVGYANWNQCDEQIVQAVKDGVNVVMWFAINLSVDPDTGNPMITNGPDMDCVGDIVQQIAALGLETTHLISIGGWNAPHVDTSNSALKIYEYFDYWNRHIAARPEKGFYGFDGFDWDIEGNDDPSSPYNQFTVAGLDTMGVFSQLAKARGNYVVSMAPAESYLDPRLAPQFDRSLLHTYEEWDPIVPNFAYHGRNCYAYLLARYGQYVSTDLPPPSTSTTSNDGSAASAAAAMGVVGVVGVDVQQQQQSGSTEQGSTFDFVTIQLYEGYSHAEYNTTKLKVPPAEYLRQFAEQITTGWEVDFSTDVELGYPMKKMVNVDKEKLVIGLANGWAGDGKFLLVYPQQVEQGYQLMEQTCNTPRGFAFWNIKDEGIASPQRPNVPVWMALGLNRFLHIR